MTRRAGTAVQALFLIVSLASLSGSPNRVPAAERVVNKFFYVVNASGADIRVRVRAGDRDLFIEAIPARNPEGSNARTMPPGGDHPARERKVRLTEGIERLEVEEMNAGRKATFEIGREWMRGPGFRITVGPRDIQLVQDYHAIRSR